MGPWITAGLLAAALLGLPAVGLAQSYKWTDKNGVVHFTDDPYELPEPQRTQVLRQLERERKPQDPDQTGDWPPIPPEARQERLPPADDQYKVRTNPNPDSPVPSEPPKPPPESQKKFWQAKAETARKNVADLDKRCQDLEAQRDENNRKGLIFATPGARANAQKASEQYDQCQEQLATARSYRDEQLPEEARKARVPPGWLE